MEFFNSLLRLLSGSRILWRQVQEIGAEAAAMNVDLASGVGTSCSFELDP